MRHVPWTPFVRAELTVISKAERKKRIQALAKQLNCSYREAKASHEQAMNDEIWVNSRYQVNTSLMPANTDSGVPEHIHLSIKRLDKDSIHDWRDLQRIKTELVGAENEAIEIYPAESRLIDTANQYHLWVLLDPDLRIPFGWNAERRVVGPGDELATNTRQRPFEE